MNKINLDKIKNIISKFPSVKILVIGDLILDEFIWGKVSRISPEAPVPVVWVDHESFMPGGASNVANNIRALGGEVSVVGIIGEDRWGTILRNELEDNNIDTRGIVIDQSRPTILKTRIVAHSQQVVRVDREKIDGLDKGIINKLVDFIQEKIKEVDAVIIEDYGKGVITPALLKKVVPLAGKLGKIITVDPKENHFSYYKGITAITPNHNEAEIAAGMEITNENDLLKAGKKLLKKFSCQAVLITLGEKGMCVFERSGKVTQIPTVAQQVYDVSGAGDTVIGTFTLAKSCGASAIEAAILSNFAAGIVVGKMGIAVVTPQELKERLKQWKF